MGILRYFYTSKTIFHWKMLTVIVLCAGVGTRNYYRKMGYELEGPYMTKLLNPAADCI